METAQVAVLGALSKERFQSEVTMNFDPRWSDAPRDRYDYGLRAEAFAAVGFSEPRGSDHPQGQRTTPT